jgi:hypothetical protein
LRIFRQFLIALTLLTLLAPLPASAQPKKAWYKSGHFWFAAATMVAASYADWHSSEAAYARGAREGNPIMRAFTGSRPGPARLGIVIGSVTAAEIGGMAWWRSRSDSNAWVTVPIAHDATHGFAAWHNAGVCHPACGSK